MIDDTLITRALDEAAAAYGEPAGAREAIVAAAAAEQQRDDDPRPRAVWRRRLPLTAVAASLVLLVAGVTLVRNDRSGTDRLTGAIGKSRTVAPVDDCPGCSVIDGQARDTTTGYGSGSGGGTSGVAPAPPRPVPMPAPAPGQPQAAPAKPQAAGSLAKVVKTGAVEIAVADGTVAATLARLETLVAGTRGFVAQSKTQESGDTPSGVVTMRVPSASYEPVLTQVRRLGEVRAATSSGQDVTADFVDNEARLRTLRQTLAVYETLLGRARSIGEVLSVQQQINGAQTQIEQIEGRLKVLTDQVSYATLTVTVVEESDETALVPAERSRLRRAFDDAKDNFAEGLAWVVAASGTLAILLICGAVLVLLWLGVRRALRRRLV